jgi:hypothetical protein
VKIHSDILRRHDLYACLPVRSPLALDVVEQGSRSRARSFTVHLEWLGSKVKGDGRRQKNSGQRQTPRN